MTYETRTVGTQPGCVLVQLTARHEVPVLDEEMAALTAAVSSSFVWVLVHLDDWTLDLMPWPDRNISREGEAGKRAEATLRFIAEEILPRFPGMPAVIGGYSLAGLFALWASTKVTLFQAVAAASPSLWIAGWSEYAETHPTFARDIYLSLGDREETAKNRAIARVGDCVRAQDRLLVRQLGTDHCTLVWEPGGHFADNAGRLARAFAWCAERLN